MKRRAAVIALWLTLVAAPAFGQGCAMCWTGANAAGKKAQRALNNGITLLLATTVGMMGGLAALVIWNRNGGQGSLNDENTDRGTSPQ